MIWINRAKVVFARPDLRQQAAILSLPVMVLMAKKTPVLRMADFRGITIVTLLTDVDAGNQHVGTVLAAGCVYVTRFAVKPAVRVMAENRVRQPDHLHV